MEQAEYPRFGKLVAELFARYPNTAMGELTISSWWKQLSRYDAPALEYAFANAGKGRPDFVPTAEVVREVAEMESKRLDAIRRRQAQGRALPPKQEQQEIDPENPWAKLASYWEQENTHYERHPSARPEDLGKQRFKQFSQLWEKTFAEKW